MTIQPIILISICLPSTDFKAGFLWGWTFSYLFFVHTNQQSRWHGARRLSFFLWGGTTSIIATAKVPVSRSQVFDQIRFPKKERCFFCHASFSSVVVFHQPIWKNMRKSNWDHLPKDRGENRKYFKPPPSKIVLKIIVLKITVSPKPPSSFSTGAAPFVLGSTLLRLGCFSTTCSCRARRRIVPFPSRWSSIYKTRRPPCS